MNHENIPERQRIDPLAVVKDYAAVPRLEYRCVLLLFSNVYHGESEI